MCNSHMASTLTIWIGCCRQAAINMLRCENIAVKRQAFATEFTHLMYTCSQASILFFDLLQYNAQKQKSSEKWGRTGNTYHVIWTQGCGGGEGGGGGGRWWCPTTNLYAINLRMSFLLFKWNSLNIVNVWGPAQWWSAREWRLLCYL